MSVSMSTSRKFGLSKGAAEAQPSAPAGRLRGCPIWCTDHVQTPDPESESHATTFEVGGQAFVSISQHVHNPEPLPELYVDVHAEGTGVNLRRLAKILLDTADYYDAVVRHESTRLGSGLPAELHAKS